jgi:hypothetical protein
MGSPVFPAPLGTAKTTSTVTVAAPRKSDKASVLVARLTPSVDLRSTVKLLSYVSDTFRASVNASVYEAFAMNSAHNVCVATASTSDALGKRPTVAMPLLSKLKYLSCVEFQPTVTASPSATGASARKSPFVTVKHDCVVVVVVEVVVVEVEVVVVVVVVLGTPLM